MVGKSPLRAGICASRAIPRSVGLAVFFVIKRGVWQHLSAPSRGWGAEGLWCSLFGTPPAPSFDDTMRTTISAARGVEST